MLSFLLSTTLLILFIASVFYFMYTNDITPNIDRYTQLALSNACLSFENTLDRAMNLAFSLYDQPDIMNFLLSETSDKETVYDISMFCNDIFICNRDIHSIYLTNATGNICSFGTACDDKEYIENLSNMINLNSKLIPIRSFVKNLSGDYIALYSFVYCKESRNDMKPSVIVNIEIDEIYKNIYSQFESTNQDIIFTNRYGIVLMSRDLDMLYTDIANEEYFIKAKKMDSSQSSFSLEINEESYYINTYSFGNRKYYAFLLTEHEIFFERIASMRKIIIICCIIVILILLVLSSYLGRTIFRPINNAIFSILNTNVNNSSESKDHWELKSITSSVNSILYKLNTVEQQKEDNLKLEKENFLKNVFLATVNISNTELISKFLEYKYFKDMSLQKSYFIVVYRVGHYKNFCTSNSASAIEFQINTVENIISQKIAERFEHSVFRIDNNHIILLGRIKEHLLSPQTFVQKEILMLSQSIQTSVFDLFNFELTVSLSDFFPFNITELRDKYTEAFKRTNYRLIFGRNILLTKHDLNTIEVKNLKINEQINVIANSIKNPEEYKKHLRTLFDLVKYCKYDFIIRTFFNLAESLEQITAGLTDDSINMENMCPDDLYMTIKSFEDYEELEDFFLALCDKANQILNEIESMGIQYHINHIIDYIDKNYQNSNITAYMMAERLSISPQYFSKLFKDITGCSFPVYVNNIRIEKAKELLLTKNRISISEICRMVGYNNVPYFTNLFKKRYNVSPTKYRQIAKYDFHK